jgi:uncharacterized protein (DUF4415 family)
MIRTQQTIQTAALAPKLKNIPKAVASDFVEPTLKGRGRPASGKETVTLRLREEVVAYYKSLGDDWRDRMAADLAKGAGR